MRLHTFVIACSPVFLGACAHTRTDSQTVTAEPAAWSTEREVVAVDTPPPPETTPTGRPRLSQTITLGQGTEAQYTPSVPPRQAGGQNPTVVVNNNIVVQGAPGYVGYGAYGAYGGYRWPTRSDGRTGHYGMSEWGTTGWEGARRTARPGQTPGVGGSWSPPPSYGPAQMK